MEQKRIIKDKDAIKRIAIFDFDGTLADTPLPDKGKETYKGATGKDWPHKGWWSREESLDMEMFDINVVQSVVDDYQAEMEKSDTLVIMMTGRIPKLSKHVEDILMAKGLTFDRYYYNTGGETGQVKINFMSQLVNEFKNTKEIHLWDDRDLHIPRFEEFGKSLDGITFSITHVITENKIRFTEGQSE